MNIAIVSGHNIIDGKLHLNHRQPQEPVGFINYLIENTTDNIYVIEPYNNLEMFDVRKNIQINTDLNILDYMFFDFISCLGENKLKFVQFLNVIKDCDIKFINPINSMLENLSKDYVYTLQNNTDLPLLPTENINTLEKMLSLTGDLLLKPLSSERANGAIKIEDMTTEDKKEYYKKYCQENNTIKQGIMCQPFNEKFAEGREKKIAVVNGKVSIARRTIPQKIVLRER